MIVKYATPIDPSGIMTGFEVSSSESSRMLPHLVIMNSFYRLFTYYNTDDCDVINDI